MNIRGTACFVEYPRKIEDLTELYPNGPEQRYEIVKIVKLSKIDYENFITDMIADREFIRAHSSLCEIGETWNCLLVQQRGHSDGVLVIPFDGCHVGWAAYYPD